VANCKRGCKFYSKNSAKPRKRRGKAGRLQHPLSSLKKKRKISFRPVYLQKNNFF